MREIASGMLPTASRTIGGYAVVRNRLPVFTKGAFSEYWRMFSADFFEKGTGAYRVANVGGSLYVADIPDLESIPAGMTDLSVSLTPFSGVSGYGGYIFYQKVNGDVVRREISSGTEVVYENFVSYVGLAAVSETDLYIFYRVTDTTYRIKVRDNSGLIDTWEGAIYGDDMVRALLDAERIDDVDYIVWETSGQRNARMVRRNGEVWSDSELVFPLDVVDDTFQFNLGGMSTINDELVVVGTMTRDDSLMLVYTTGIEHFTHGREMFIAKGRNRYGVISSSNDSNTYFYPIGKMLSVDDILYVACAWDYHTAPSTIFFGSDRTDQKATIDVHNVRFDSESNRVGRVIIEASTAADMSLIKEGNVLDWYATVNSVSARMGRFVIDAVSTSDDEVGSKINIVARSQSGQMLSMWNSDSSFDYWSQTKVRTDALQIGEAIRGPGEWVETDDAVKFMNLNRPGVMYTIAKKTRNGVSAGEFKVTTEVGYDGLYGVAIAYHRETPQDAAERLGSSFATFHEVVNHGLFFVVDSTDGSSALSLVIDGEWTEIATGSEAISSSDWHWLRIDFHEGRVRCYYKTGTSWIEVIDALVETDEDHPLLWFDDEIGRACIYINNATDYVNNYAFQGDSVIIPVESNADIVSSGRVLVDNELIDFDGKSPNLSLATASEPLKWVEGKTYKNAPHVNQQAMPNFLIASSGSDSDLKQAWNAREGYFHGGTFWPDDNYIIREVDLYLEKYNANGNTSGIQQKLYIGTETSDDKGVPPSNTLLGSSWVRGMFPGPDDSRAMLGVGNYHLDEGWVRFKFNGVPIQANHGCIIYQKDCGLPSNNSYKYWMSVGSYAARGAWYVRCSANGKWYKTKSRNVIFKVWGGFESGPGFEIYLDEVDDQLDTDYFNDCALLCTDGKGKNRAMKITGYDYHAPHQKVWNESTQEWDWEDKNYRRVFVRHDPGDVFDETSEFIIVPALTISDRGEDVDEDNIASAHSVGITSLVPADFDPDEYSSGILIRNFEYYSADRDMTLGWMLSEVARKANILEIDEGMRVSEEISGTADYDWEDTMLAAAEGETAIIEYEVGDWNTTGGVGMVVFSTAEGDIKSPDNVSVLVFEDSIKFYSYDDEGTTLLESFSLPQSIEGKFTISFQKESFAVWNAGRYLTHYSWVDGEAEESTFEGRYEIATVDINSPTYTVSWSELDIRIDNFILDIGQSGLTFFNGLIGEKRVFWLDDQDGGLRLFRSRETINPSTPASLTVSQVRGEKGTEIATRLRAEGIEISELVDFEAIAELGNIFRLVGLREPNNIAEMAREMTLTLADDIRTLYPYDGNGAADPRVEPEDIFLVTTDTSEHKLILVKSVELMLRSGKVPVFDMTISGEVWGESDLRAPSFTSRAYTTLPEDAERKFTITIDGNPDATISIV